MRFPGWSRWMPLVLVAGVLPSLPLLAQPTTTNSQTAIPLKGSGLKILDGQPTRIFFSGNTHHPTFGKEKLALLLARHFEGKSPFRVDGLADARKDPITQKPIPPAKIPELIRFLEPEFKAARPEGERFIILNYVIVEERGRTNLPTGSRKGPMGWKNMRKTR